MAHIHIETHPIGHVLHIEGSQVDVTTLLALAILGSERLKNVILDALDAQDYLMEQGVKALPVEGQMISIDDNKTVN